MGSKCEVGGLPGKPGGGTAEREQRVGTRPPRRDAEPSELRDSGRARPGPSDSCRRERVNGRGETGVGKHRWGSERGIGMRGSGTRGENRACRWGDGLRGPAGI